MTERETSSRRVLVVGASKGLGRAVAVAFAAEGAAVAVGFHRDLEGAEETVDLIAAAGGRAVAVGGDLSEEMAANQVVERAWNWLGGLDIVIHSAVDASRDRLLDVDGSIVLTSVARNGMSFLWVARAAARLFSGPGSIVFLSSQGSRDVVPDYGLIGPPKALAEAYARYLAVELAPRGVNVNIVECGPVETESFNRSVAAPGSAIEALRRRTPAGRGIEPGEVGAVVAGIADPTFSMMTGQRVVLDGGLSLWA